jgi:DNA-binding transcriptional regulator YdaS (Cro superfamily)
VWRDSGVSWHSVNRAKRHKVGLKVAVLISRATGGAVSVAELTDCDALDTEPRRVA